LGLVLPSGLDEKHREQLAKFSALSGERFDREFVRHMIEDHKKAVAAFEKQSERGADADLKAFAGRALPALHEHLRMVQRIHDKMQMRRHLPSTNANR
jgi:putative membrane protein